MHTQITNAHNCISPLKIADTQIFQLVSLIVFPSLILEIKAATIDSMVTRVWHPSLTFFCFSNDCQSNVGNTSLAATTKKPIYVHSLWSQKIRYFSKKKKISPFRCCTHAKNHGSPYHSSHTIQHFYHYVKRSLCMDIFFVVRFFFSRSFRCLIELMKKD